MAKRDTRTVAQKNRQLRQDELRALLAEQCRLQHIIDNIAKMEDVTNPMDSSDFQRIKAANEQRIKLLGKYLPDLKAMELSGPDGEPIDLRHVAREMTPEEAAAHYAELMRGKQ